MIYIKNMYLMFVESSTIPFQHPGPHSVDLMADFHSLCPCDELDLGPLPGVLY